MWAESVRSELPAGKRTPHTGHSGPTTRSDCVGAGAAVGVGVGSKGDGEGLDGIVGEGFEVGTDVETAEGRGGTEAEASRGAASAEVSVACGVGVTAAVTGVMDVDGASGVSVSPGVTSVIG